ncbi:hypothetical protein FOMPIDRAFT_1047252 [Fomitopsis schrenkii]|uniref:BTB domain-containing protein n=1 Tax=Fomitopsis schrenkii TaxID=2126942 RepID=S8EJ04_FOMSC|nr:hypothetical protein FOMPIDRAFT_1047252 [Fomitopsis schrenkii]
MDTPSSRSPSPLTISSWDFSPWSSPPSSASSPPGSPPFFFSQFKHESDLENDPEQGSSTDSALTEEPYQQEPDLVLEEIDEEIDEQGAEEQGGQVEDDDLYEEALRDPTPVPIIIDVQEPPRTPTPPPPPTPPPRHPEFYFSDGTVIFKCKDFLFNIHKYFLARESPLFHDLFQLPHREGAVEGRDDFHPIQMNGHPSPEAGLGGGGKPITDEEFADFLRFLYYGMHEDCGLTLRQWINILSVSTGLDCAKIRKRAIKEIHEHRPRIDPVEKIALAQTYRVYEWFVPSYRAICQRPQPLTLDEGGRLGFTAAILLAQAREAARQEPAPARESTPPARGGARGGRGGGVGGGGPGRTQAAALAPPEPEPHPSTASLWQELEGLTIPDPEESFDAQRVADIIREIFPTAESEGQPETS